MHKKNQSKFSITRFVHFKLVDVHYKPTVTTALIMMHKKVYAGLSWYVSEGFVDMHSQYT